MYKGGRLHLFYGHRIYTFSLYLTINLIRWQLVQKAGAEDSREQQRPNAIKSENLFAIVVLR